MVYYNSNNFNLRKHKLYIIELDKILDIIAYGDILSTYTDDLSKLQYSLYLYKDTLTAVYQVISLDGQNIELRSCVCSNEQLNLFISYENSGNRVKNLPR